jgi:hypothetical protein
MRITFRHRSAEAGARAARRASKLVLRSRDLFEHCQSLHTSIGASNSLVTSLSLIPKQLSVFIVGGCHFANNPFLKPWRYSERNYF